MTIIKFRIRNSYFYTSLFPILTFISLFLLLISLGVWQIYRGNEKSRLQMQYSDRQRARPIILDQLKKINTNQIYSQIIAKGSFDNQHNFYLDNKIYQHHIGYEVLTPFILKNSHDKILVNRGWIPQGYDRETLPVIKPITKNITIEGLLLWPQKTFRFETKVEKKMSQRLQTLTPEFLYKNKLQPFIIMLDKQGPYSFVPLWRPVIFPASRHYAYAFQWFALSLVLVIAFIISQLTHI